MKFSTTLFYKRLWAVFDRSVLQVQVYQTLILQNLILLSYDQKKLMLSEKKRIERDKKIRISGNTFRIHCKLLTITLFSLNFQPQYCKNLFPLCKCFGSCSNALRYKVLISFIKSSIVNHANIRARQAKAHLCIQFRDVRTSRNFSSVRFFSTCKPLREETQPIIHRP